MPCTAPFFRGSKILLVAFNKRIGTTFVELIFTLLIFSLIFIPITASIQVFSRHIEGLNASMFITKIRTEIMEASSSSLCTLKETRIVYNKGSKLNGFEFRGTLFLEFTHYGQIKKGTSVKLAKNKETYYLTVRPIT